MSVKKSGLIWLSGFNTGHDQWVIAEFKEAQTFDGLGVMTYKDGPA